MMNMNQCGAEAAPCCPKCPMSASVQLFETPTVSFSARQGHDAVVRKSNSAKLLGLLLRRRRRAIFRNPCPAMPLRRGDSAPNHARRDSAIHKCGSGKSLRTQNWLPMSSETRGGHVSGIRNLMISEEVAENLGGANTKKKRTKPGIPEQTGHDHGRPGSWPQGPAAAGFRGASEMV